MKAASGAVFRWRVDHLLLVLERLDFTLLLSRWWWSVLSLSAWNFSIAAVLVMVTAGEMEHCVSVGAEVVSLVPFQYV